MASVANAPIPDTSTSVQPIPFHASVMFVMCWLTMLDSSVCIAVTMSAMKKSISQFPPPAIMPGKVKPMSPPPRVVIGES